jgi:hypothetical protein
MKSRRMKLKIKNQKNSKIFVIDGLILDRQKARAPSKYSQGISKNTRKVSTTNIS